MLFALRNSSIFVIYKIINVLINNNILAKELFNKYFFYDKKR